MVITTQMIVFAAVGALAIGLVVYKYFTTDITSKK
jgi:hypothetical protein